MRGRMLFGAVAGLLLLSVAVRGADAATVTAGVGLNLRSCPSLDCTIYTVMPYGAYAGLLDGPDANGWYQVQYGGITGWAHGGWLADDGSAPLEPGAPSFVYVDPIYSPAPVAEPQWAQGNDPAPAPATTSGGGVSYITGAPYSGGVIDAITYWAGQYGVSADWLLGVAACESGYDPNAVGPNGEIGVFQFMSSTFYAYGGSNIWDPWDQARVAASMFSQGLSWHWLCA